MKMGTSSDLTASPHWPLLTSAAVMTTVSPDDFTSSDGTRADMTAIAALLMKYADPIKAGPARGRWRLREGVRRRVLATLRSRERLLGAVPPNRDAYTKDPTQRAFLSLVTESSQPSLSDQSLEQLLALERAAGWLDAARITIPVSRQEIAIQIEREKLLEPLRRLVIGFEGRTRETERLRKYVDTLPSESWLEAGLRFSQRFAGRVFGAHKPLMIHGPGGAGKSTLVAKFIIDHADRKQSQPLAFVLLDFDRSNLDPLRPDALVSEIAAQLRVQFPDLADRFEQLREDVDIRFTAEESVQQSVSSHFNYSTALRQEFTDLLRQIAKHSGQNVLFVLDTFEIVQRRGPSAVFTLLDFVEEMLWQVRAMRVVLVGRSEVRAEDFGFTDAIPKTDPLPLEGFDLEAARAYLRARLKNYSLPPVNDEDLDWITMRVRGNPLGLRLAAQVFAREGKKGIDEAISGRQLKEQIADEQVQSLLHTRIVEHLENEDLKRIANPGLIVRRINVKVIEQVLAEPCALDLQRITAEHLLSQLRNEVSLVERIDADTVKHRTDVRLIMLPALRRSLGAVARQVDERAVRYWQKESGVAARAEEIYHRLWRGDSENDLAERWIPGLRAHLEEVLDEFESVAPGDWARIWLSERLDRDLPEALRQTAGQIAFERDAERKARLLLADGKVDEVLRVTNPRPGEYRLPGSALWLIDIDAHLLRGQTTEALALVEQALARLGNMVNPDHTLALLSRRAMIQERFGHFKSAQCTTAEAMILARATNDRIALFTCALALSRLARKTNHRNDPSIVSSRAEAIALLEHDELQRALADRPALLREAAAELGPDKPELIADALERIGLEAETIDGALVVPETLNVWLKGVGAPAVIDAAARARRKLEASIADTIRHSGATDSALKDIANLYANAFDKFLNQIIL